MKNEYTTISHKLTHFSVKSWENVLFELGSVRVMYMHVPLPCWARLWASWCVPPACRWSPVPWWPPPAAPGRSASAEPAASRCAGPCPLWWPPGCRSCSWTPCARLWATKAWISGLRWMNLSLWLRLSVIHTVASREERKNEDLEYITDSRLGKRDSKHLHTEFRVSSYLWAELYVQNYWTWWW